MNMVSNVIKRFSLPSRSVENLTLLEVIKPVYLMLSVFGLFPYSVKFRKDECVVIIRKSIYFNSICAVSVILVVYLSFVLHVQEVFEVTESNSMTEVFLTKMNYLLELSGLLLFCTVSYITAYKNKLVYINVFNRMLSSFNKVVHRNRDMTFRYLKCQVRLIIGFICFLLALQLLVNSTRNDNFWKITLVTLTFILPQTIQFIVIGFYYTMVVTVVAVLRNINEEIKNVVKEWRVPGDFVRLELRQINLRQLEGIYVKVLEVKRDINRVFQACLLATSLQCFHSLVSESHIIYHGVLVGRTFSIHDTCNCSIWIMYQLMKIYVMASSGNLLKLEAANIGRTLYNVSTEKQDMRIFLEVQHFSTLMSYQTVELSVYGYFPLDGTLIFNMVASAAMYLTIFVQLDKNS